MRFSLMFVTFMCLSSASFAADLTAVEILESDVTPLRADSLLGPEAQVVCEQMPMYHQMVRDADSLSHQTPLTILLIGQVHPGIDTDLRDVTDSQAGVFRLLEALKPEVTGAEGYLFGRLTVNNVRAQSEKKIRRYQVFASERAVDRHITLRQQIDGMVAFVWQYPLRRVIGVESEALQNFGFKYHGLSADTVARYRQKYDVAWDQVALDIRRARTELAIAALILDLHQQKKHFGVVVMGMDHVDEWPYLAGRFGLQTAQYSSLDVSDDLIKEMYRIHDDMKRRHRD